MAHGVPVVRFNCKSGPSEIVRDGVNGFLVPAGNVSALALAMEKLISNSTLRLAMGKKALEVSERLYMRKISSRWDDLFQKLGIAMRRNPQDWSKRINRIATGSL
jgi:glycosyltransferase involved in cell wall biosynthesis